MGQHLFIVLLAVWLIRRFSNIERLNEDRQAG